MLNVYKTYFLILFKGRKELKIFQYILKNKKIR